MMQDSDGRGLESLLLWKNICALDDKLDQFGLSENKILMIKMRYVSSGTSTTTHVFFTMQPLGNRVNRVWSYVVKPSVLFFRSGQYRTNMVKNLVFNYKRAKFIGIIEIKS